MLNIITFPSKILHYMILMLLNISILYVFYRFGIEYGYISQEIVFDKYFAIQLFYYDYVTPLFEIDFLNIIENEKSIFFEKLDTVKQIFKL